MNNKAFLQAYKDKKGSEGEDFVQSGIEEAIKLSQIKTYKTYRNVILQFPSVFGNYYGMTTEIDHVVVTESFIFLFETKNHDGYSKTERLYWELKNGEKIVNPIRQNHTHKLILASELGIERECIKSIECFAEVPQLNYISAHLSLSPSQIDAEDDPNNEIMCFNEESFIEDLAYLFISENREVRFNFEEIIKKIDEVVSKQKRMKLNEIHLENIAEANKILNAQKGNHQKLEYTDVGICPCCGKDTIKLVKFRPDLEPGRKRRRYAYRTCFVCKNFNCSRYDKSQGEFDESDILLGEDFPLTKKLTGSSIQIKTIQERIGITGMEKFVETVKSRMSDLTKQNSWLTYENNELNSRLKTKEIELENALNRNKVITESLRQITTENGRFKPVLFGLFYIKQNN